MDPELINQIGSWSSFIGLIITIVLVVFGYFINNKVKDLQRNFLFDVRIKKLLKQLDTSKSSYPKYLNNYKNSIKDIRFEISQTEAILKNLKPKVTGIEKRNISELCKEISLMKIGDFISEEERNKSFPFWTKSLFIVTKETSEEDLWNFYTELSALQTSLENLVDDKKYFKP